MDGAGLWCVRSVGGESSFVSGGWVSGEGSSSFRGKCTISNFQIKLGHHSTETNTQKDKTSHNVNITTFAKNTTNIKHQHLLISI